MGLCCSKTEPRRPSPPAEPILKLEKKTPVEEVVTEKKQVFVIAQTAKKAAAVAGSVDDVNLKGNTPVKNVEADSTVVLVAEEFKAAPVKTSGCSKEDADDIHIQCGRLSRSSSGNETGRGHRRWCSGSKRSYDFDNERKGDEEEEEWTERTVSRSSPRRRTHGRDRSGSMERRGSSGGGGGRRVSRSPGRRSEVPASSGSAGERSRQPAKMVSVPAREKTRESSPSATAAHKRRSEMGGALRDGSPRSHSPANTSRTTMTNEIASSHHNPAKSQSQSLSRSSSRKLEQSPYRRNPMVEIDDNVPRGGHQNGSHDSKTQKSRGRLEGTKKLTPLESNEATENVAPMTISAQRTGGAAIPTNTVKTNIVVTDCRTKEQQHIKAKKVEELMDKGSLKCSETVNVGKEEANVASRTKQWRRPSRGLDHAPDSNTDNSVNAAAYATNLLEDIHSYRHQHQNTALSLPACLSKACSIIEAVADLTSTSENKSFEADTYKDDDDDGIPSETYVRRGSIYEAVRNDSNLLELSLHKYVTVRDKGCEMEPQESAGSNSFVGQPLASPWEPASVESTDRHWTLSSINGDEVEQEQQMQEEASGESGAHGRRSSRGYGGNSFMTPTSSSKRKEHSHLEAQ